ncbi:hypothetical protein RHOSPDRAFT_26512 [Rhodotorula sp. JG-1b]|nr:hypothetical protein RHOSPDRAFT_26512 [Rhodotorula sp. JG-1b]
MSGQLTLNRPSANRLLASLHQLKDACQPEQEASEEPLVPAETTVDLDFLEKRVAAFIGRGWSDKVLEGLAEVYADVAASVTFLLGLKESTDDHHVAFLGLVEFHVFEQHLAKFASYCRDLASAGSALARLKVMEAHMNSNSNLAKMMRRIVSMSGQLLDSMLKYDWEDSEWQYQKDVAQQIDNLRQKLDSVLDWPAKREYLVGITFGDQQLAHQVSAHWDLEKVNRDGSQDRKIIQHADYFSNPSGQGLSDQGKDWSIWLRHCTSIWEDWTRTDRGRVTLAIKALTCELNKVKDKEEKTKLLDGARQSDSRLRQAIYKANKRFGHNATRMGVYEHLTTSVSDRLILGGISLRP